MTTNPKNTVQNAADLRPYQPGCWACRSI